MTQINNNNVVIKNDLTANTRKFQSYFGVTFAGKKGKIVGPLINSRHEQQGFRVRFPRVRIKIGTDWKGRPRTKVVKNFEFPFYNEEIERIQEKIVFPTRRSQRRTPTQLQRDIRAVKRLKEQGIATNELAKRFGVHRTTVHRWSHI